MLSCKSFPGVRLELESMIQDTTSLVGKHLLRVFPIAFNGDISLPHTQFHVEVKRCACRCDKCSILMTLPNSDDVLWSTVIEGSALPFIGNFLFDILFGAVMNFDYDALVALHKDIVAQHKEAIGWLNDKSKTVERLQHTLDKRNTAIEHLELEIEQLRKQNESLAAKMSANYQPNAGQAQAQAQAGVAVASELKAWSPAEHPDEISARVRHWDADTRLLDAQAGLARAKTTVIREETLNRERMLAGGMLTCGCGSAHEAAATAAKQSREGTNREAPRASCACQQKAVPIASADRAQGNWPLP